MPDTYFIWDELSDNVRMEVDETGAVTAEYMNEPGQFGKLLSQRRNGTNRFYHFDAQGSTRQLTNDTETVTDTYTYTSFGTPVTGFGASSNPFRFNGSVGYFTDLEIDRVYVRRRFFNPNVGRWISTDPLGVVFGPVYLYVDNNSLNTSDPSGLYSNCGGCCCCVDSADYSHTKLELDMPALATHAWGHSLTHTSKLRFPPGNGDGLGCGIEWFECSTLDGSRGQKPGEWWPAHKYERWRDFDHNWDDYYDGKLPFDCPGGALTLEWSDNPKVPFATDRISKFVIRVSSDLSCDCMQDGIGVRSITVAFTQRLQSKEGARFDPSLGRISPEQWEKWEITDGIDDKEDPTGCNLNNVPFSPPNQLGQLIE